MNFFELQLWLNLLTLTFLEIVLGVDNLVFISIISHSVVKHQQKMTRRLGLIGALVMRLILLAGAFWVISLTKPLFVIFDQTLSARDLILIIGGLFLLIKATIEIHSAIEGNEAIKARPKLKSMWNAISQIMLLDIVFSLDSILTAIGLTDQYWIMAVAIIIAILTMLLASEPLHQFIHNHPTVKMLALSFLLLIGAILIADGFDYHVPREYIYFAISFSIMVEIFNNLARKHKKKLRSKVNL